MNRARVCVLGDFLEGKDGISRVFADISWYFEERVVIFSAKYRPDYTFNISKKTEIFKTKYKISDSFIDSLKFILIGSREIARFISQQENISILNPHGFYNIIPTCMIRFWLPRRKIRISAVIYDNEEVVLMRNNLIRKLAHNFYLILFGLFLRLNIINDVLVLDDNIKDLVSKLFHTKKVKRIKLGVSFSLINSSRRAASIVPERIKEMTKKAEGSLKLFFQGILIPRRRIEDLIEALHLILINNKNNLILYIGGYAKDKQYVKSLNKLVEEFDLKQKVFFLDRLSDDELVYMYEFCDIFIFPSNPQSWGLAPLEAMLFGKSVIMTTGCGVSQVLNRNIALIIPPNSPATLKDAIVSLKDNIKLREEVGRRAREYVLENLTYVNTGRELEKIWKLAEAREE